MHVIATAGHVDHGKSTLIMTLTGIDPDRLAEEKARGLTIDLGFAWLDLPSGIQIGIVDVPGHERFIKNMLAGVGAVDATMFVVAANEGWKPQSQEHLDILDLLGVTTGVIAVTKSDTVAEERLAEVIDEVRRRCAGTSLSAAEVIAVSAKTGAGIDLLVAELDRLISDAPEPEDLGRPRLWIDRSFTIKGSGTVVTGTLLEGGLATGDEVEILPDHIRARIRSIQSHRREVASIRPGDRTAVNLTGTEHRQLSRGDVMTLPGSHRTTRRFLVELRLLPNMKDDPPEKGAFKVYVGSAELDASVRILGSAEDRLVALIRTEQDAPLMFGDRMVLREAGRRQTIGGGRVIETSPEEDATGRSLFSVATRRLEISTRDAYAQMILSESGYIEIAELSRRTATDVPASALRGRRFAFDQDFVEQMENRILPAVSRHHEQHPLEPGLPLTEVRTLVGLRADAFDDAIDAVTARGEVTRTGTVLAVAGFAPAIGGPEKESLMQRLSAGGSNIPTLDELRVDHPLPLIKALVGSGELVQITHDLVYPAAFIAEVKARLTEHVRANGPFTVAQFRDLFGTTRKYAVPLLEFLDHQGFTRRSGDLRALAD